MSTQSALTILLTTSIALLAAGCGDDATPGLSADTSRDLQYLQQEEKLARDVYLTLFDSAGLNIFNNIAASEQKHMDAVAGLLEGNGLTDPAYDDTVGVFSNAELGGLYVKLVADGRQDEAAALTAGATIEDLDINDIEAMIGRVEMGAVLDVYTALQCGSRNHMRSFYGQLNTRNVEYVAQFLSATELAAIIAATTENCGSI